LHLVNDLVNSTWALAALRVAIESGMLASLTEPRTVAFLSERAGMPAPLAESILDVAVALNLVQRDGDVFSSTPGIRPLMGTQGWEWLLAKLRSAQLQSQYMVQHAAQRDLVPGWRHTNPELLLAQGRLGSDEMVTMFINRILPHLGKLAERLDAGPTSFLDVGAGVGALSLAMARHWPELRVVAIEPAPEPFQEAQRLIANSGMAERIELRMQRVEEIVEEKQFDLVWLPQMFIPGNEFSQGLTSVWRALRPGGWVWLPVLNDSLPNLYFSLSKLRNILWGGNLILCDALTRLLENAGFDPVIPVGNNVAGEHLHLVGRRPDEAGTA
jgi:2-polyprenyl-3-methyl-5-hydroxy-6-metoxy-1,4-benzoquinol methylase